MDRAGNTLPIRERPPLKSPENRGDTVKDGTISDLRKQILELKKRLKQQEIEKLPLCMRRSNEVQHLYKAASRSTDQLQRSRKTVLENVKVLSFIHKKVKDRERRSKYPELKAAMLERKLDLANVLRDSDQLHKCYDHEHASNGQSQRLLKIASERKDGYDEIEKANTAVFEAEEKMEAAEQNLLQ
ncbi:hypothetical protein FOPG_14802 [Fusarium oxysporum f. sp. conglutinans race 2 54008]|nr:hypothetical protein FOPG_14802 [Fusarium oxysporum f. sp. conglutinans race 2 54008]